MTAAPAAAQLPRPGDTIAGKYVLDRLLGQGGMGAVFAAKHIKLSKAVAIKIMLADASNPEAAQRFINEGRAAANIQNEHVVRVDDVDEERGYAYMVLELLEGEDLAQVLERDPAHRLAPHVAVGYVLQALKGVIQAHAIGIVHRDLKPSNLFLAKRKDGSVVVKVLDFGISKAQGSSALAASPSALTSTKAMLGSPLYMSPEQLRSSKSVDQRADIWAIGIILYELMTGSLPFMGDNLGELFAAILERDPASLRTHVPDVLPALDEIVLRCLQRRPEHRFQTATELADALAPFAAAQPAAGALGGTAMLAPGAVAPGALTPTGPQPAHPFPPAGVTTGSGPRAIGGTIALGASTPQPGMHQTGSGGWQRTGGGSGAVSLPKSSAPVVLGAVAAAVLVLLGAAGVVLMWKAKPSKTEPVAESSAVVSAVPPPSAEASAVATQAPEPPPPSSASEPANSAAATATAGAVATTTAAATGGAKVTRPGPIPKVDPPKEQPKSTPTSKPHGNGLQDSR